MARLTRDSSPGLKDGDSIPHRTPKLLPMRSRSGTRLHTKLSEISQTLRKPKAPAGFDTVEVTGQSQERL